MNKSAVSSLIDEINSMTVEEIKIMEVCGTHTQMISRMGLRTLLSPNIRLLSGPGCPVCVSEENFIDNAVYLTDNDNVTIATFGDMMRVRGTGSSLLEEKSKGKDVRILYSPLELIDMAEKNKDKNFVFLGVGFETTAPVIALAIKNAAERNIENLFFLTSLKLMPPILHYIGRQTDNKIRGVICPGHVASVTGSDYFRFITDEYGISAAVCGFEAWDILTGIRYLVKQAVQGGIKEFKNLYPRSVKNEGNRTAVSLMNHVFEVGDGVWRGIGEIKNSSLQINEKYKNFDAMNVFKLKNKFSDASTGCRCRDILLGNKTPFECGFFGNQCSPANPHGPCMVSREGSCSIAFRYREGI
ncbi:MAG: hydrogenase formation protein HypD [Sedimentibacter sp.]|uniref:hydrogenase formation protein HypD n=1 Tax=Sedimentibacter sp. TaxID=1960295 RepID=UPI003158415B